MAKITLLVGPPGSGKSTFARELIYEDGDNGLATVYINQDLQGRQEHLTLFKKAVEDGKDIIVDRMNFSKGQRNTYLDFAKSRGYSTKIVVFHVPFKTCIERANNRKDHPTIKNSEDANRAIHYFFTHYERVQDEEADEVFRNGWVDKQSTDAIWCDLDGTLSDVSNRRHHVRVEKPSKPDWKAFFENMDKDPVNEWCRDILVTMHEKKDIVYATGRPEEYKEKTENWLISNGLRFENSHLFMRNLRDYRKDDIVKEIILEFEVKTRYNVLFAIDDRKQVVDMLRKHGITVLQCAEGDF